MSFKKIDHINIVVKDLEAAKNFFLDLGFVVLTQDKLEGVSFDKTVNLSQVKAEYVALQIPGSQTNLELITYYTPPGGKDPKLGIPNQIGYRHMAIEVNGIEKVVSDLKNKGITFFSDIEVYNGRKKLCYFSGPEGILIELAEYE